ncbi:MAG: GNAT family N-acetyltransferase [Sphingomonadaceae bacterium]|nr:GNAT family N-acetyltransferase [Sphingomonadaceae bacterium]
MPVANISVCSAALTVVREHGFSAAIDAVAEAAHPPHRALRRAWYAATVGAAAPSTLVLRDGALVRAALPLRREGPPLAGGRSVAGYYWPLNVFPVAHDLSDVELTVLLTALRRHASAFRMGPVNEDDPLAEAIARTASAAGWRLCTRRVATRFEFALDRPGWPKPSRLKRNRYHEKQLSAHGALSWHYHSGADWTERLVAELADVEGRSWINQSDACNFHRPANAAFWLGATRDPEIADALEVAVLRIDGRAGAFSFAMVSGDVAYLIASAYDQAIGEDSPGKVLAYRHFVRLRERGVRYVDWGGGDGGYKSRMGAVRAADIVDLLLVPSWVPFGSEIARRWQRSGNQASDEPSDAAAEEG